MLTTSVFAICITAPLGAIMINTLGTKWLEYDGDDPEILAKHGMTEPRHTKKGVDQERPTNTGEVDVIQDISNADATAMEMINKPKEPTPSQNINKVGIAPGGEAIDEKDAAPNTGGR